MSEILSTESSGKSSLLKLDSFIGRVSSVDANSVEMLLPASGTSASRSVKIGDFVVVRSGALGLLARLASLRLSASGSFTPDSHAINEQVAVLEVLVSVDLETCNSHGGVIHTPAVGDEVFLAPAQLVQRVVQGEAANNVLNPVRITFAQLQNAEKTYISFTPEQLFGRHLAILGATGGGKSWTVARLIEESSRLNSKIILFDATGEYSTLRHGVRHLAIGGVGKNEEDADQVAVPFYHLTEDDLFKIFKPSGESQAPKLRAAMKSLKLADLSSELAPDGTIIKAHKSRLVFDEEYGRNRKKIESPLADFKISNLPRQIENECVHPQRSPTEPHFWGGISSRELSNCMPLIARISDIVTAPGLKAIFKPGKLPSLFREIHKFLEDRTANILRISLAHFAFEHNAREIVVNAIGRHLLDLSRVGSFSEAPLVVFLDEAHQFVHSGVGEENLEFSLNAFALIAKEGRKFGLNICLATQRPRDIPEGVLSQIGSLIVHRIINDNDRYVIERACGDFDKTSAARVPTLSPGESIIIGIDFGLPVSVKILPPENRPSFEGPNYQRYWKPQS